MIPKDPMIFLSYLNTQLRDCYSSLEELCASCGLEKEQVTAQMDAIDYHYDAENNRFV